MPLSAKDPIAKWIYDFKKSDAPQFKGKSGEERKAMAVAAYMDAKKGSKKEECWTGYKQQGMKKKGDKMVPNCVPESVTPSSQEFVPSPTGGKRYATTKMEGKVECPQCKGDGCNHCDNKGYHMKKESVETDSAAKKPVTVTDPTTGKKRVVMRPAHHKELDHDHKKEIGEEKKNCGCGQDPCITYGDVDEKTNNLVAKHARKYNKAHVMANRKKKQKKGYVKHKGKQYEQLEFHESMDPRDHTDKPGHLVVVTKPSGKKMIKHYHPTAQGAKKYADRINKTNRVGHKATVHKTDGRRIMESGSEDVVEYLVVKKNPSFSGSSSSSSSSRTRKAPSTASGQSVTTTSGNGYKISRNLKTGKTSKSRYNVGGKNTPKESFELEEATSKKLRDKMKELAGGQLPRNSIELRALKMKAQDELRKGAKAKKAAPKKQSTTKTSTGKKHMGSMEAGDRNIVMQLRKAQDLKGNHDILVSPKGRTVRLPKTMIDKLLKRFDSLQKPQDKRRFQIMVTKELRKRAK